MGPSAGQRACPPPPQLGQADSLLLTLILPIQASLPHSTGLSTSGRWHLPVA